MDRAGYLLTIAFYFGVALLSELGSEKSDDGTNGVPLQGGAAAFETFSDMPSREK
jgi:hypothetical protein